MQNNITCIVCLLLEGYTAKLRPLVFFLLKTSSIFLSQLLTLNVLDESYFRNGPDTLNWIYCTCIFYLIRTKMREGEGERSVAVIIFVTFISIFSSCSYPCFICCRLVRTISVKSLSVKLQVHYR